MRFSIKHFFIGLLFSLFALNAHATMLSSSSIDGHKSVGPTTLNALHLGGSQDVWSRSQTYGFDDWADAASWWDARSSWTDALEQIFGQTTGGWLVDIFKWKLCYFANCCSTGDHPGQPTQPTDPTGPTDPATPPADVPAPGSSIALFALGLVGLMAWTRRRRWKDGRVA